MVAYQRNGQEITAVEFLINNLEYPLHQKAENLSIAPGDLLNCFHKLKEPPWAPITLSHLKAINRDES